MTQKYSYRDFTIQIDHSKKWGYRSSKDGDIFNWHITHMGYKLESGRDNYSNISDCKRDAEIAVDKKF